MTDQEQVDATRSEELRLGKNINNTCIYIKFEFRRYFDAQQKRPKRTYKLERLCPSLISNVIA